jgi:uncharacterized protein YyaL (SSP411 family)
MNGSRGLTNKIEWLDWGKDSFDKARSTGKPILLDIKGSWCHWCHVMDNTSYSDPSIISMVNKNFIPIRVDTDRRPDVNRRYNMGGWPTTAFLDSEGKIITGGTYIPPEQLREALRSVLDFYSKNKGKLGSKLRPVPIPKGSGGSLTEKITTDIATTIAVNFDIDYGGFGFEQKFPHTDALEYALLRHRYFGDKEMLTLATKTLEKMAKGGMYDHVEGGFFRYSTTRDWSIPHFEKMAEDNAKLLAVYLRAYQLTRVRLFREITEGIVQYVKANLSDSERGGFYGSQDADEEYYRFNMPERKNRKSPSIDKTLYTSYNALFISSFLLASQVLDEPDLGKFALKTLDRIMEPSDAEGQLFHYQSDTEPTELKGLLVDHAALLHALIDAFQHTGKRSYLDRALKLADSSLKTLRDESRGGFFDIPIGDADLGELRLRDKPLDENSVMASGLLRLSWISENEEYSKAAGRALELFSGDYERYGLMGASYGMALDLYLNGPIGITIVGYSKNKEFSDFKAQALKLYSPRKYVLYLDPSRDSNKMTRLGYDKANAPVGYVCVGKVCGPPLKEPSQIEASISSLLEAQSLKS